jgi:hypothetical protein
MSEERKGWHKHKNGGGWVEDTAVVEASCYVGPNARVYGNAQVSGTARVYGNAQVSGTARVYGDAWVYGTARVSGDAWVSGDARVSGDAWEQSPLYIQGTRHALTNSRYNHITIGCQEYTFAYWQKHYKAIGRAEGYSKEQIEEYGAYIRLFCKVGK